MNGRKIWWSLPLLAALVAGTFSGVFALIFTALTSYYLLVEGERAMQLQSDPFLGWTTMDGRDWLQLGARTLRGRAQPVDLFGAHPFSNAQRMTNSL